MYGYLTNNSILSAYTQWQNNNVEKYKSGTLLEYDELFTLTNTNRTIVEGLFNRSMIYLEHKGYLEIDRSKLPKMEVILRPKGRVAALGLFFKQKNDQILHKIFVDFGLVASNITIALIAFFALHSDTNNKLETLQKQINQISSELQQVKQMQIIQSHPANPPKDSLKRDTSKKPTHH